MSEQKTNPEKVLSKCIKAFNKNPLTAPEIVDVLSNLMYVLGACISGFEKEGPDMDEALKMYYAEPNDLGHALMAQAFQMNVTWHESLAKHEEPTP